MEKPSARHFFRDLNRRSAVVSGKWKPLSSDWRNLKKQDAAPRTVPEEVGGVGPWWKKVASSFGSQVSLSQQPLKRAKKIDGAAYFRRGKRKADKCDFLQAAALYNLALVEQREELGENHLDCGATLNEIGVCWMMMGEHYPAKTAFEEALYIRQLCLGAGAPELAETTNNIWMLLHEQRAEMEDFLDEKGDEEE
jgi:tetratricopeptide (TPR) repeat protein